MVLGQGGDQRFAPYRFARQVVCRRVDSWREHEIELFFPEAGNHVRAEHLPRGHLHLGHVLSDAPRRMGRVSYAMANV
jgi:hypothetical protein